MSRGGKGVRRSAEARANISAGQQRRRESLGLNERAAAMAALYRAGYTLRQIGDEFGGITRERVRQILSCELGMTKADGGAAAREKKRAERRRIEAEAKCMARTGCTLDQLAELRRIAREMMAAGMARNKTPISAFAHQRHHAISRGIAWEMTLWQWWTVWQQSGHWASRGKGHGNYVMSRNGDEGPYAPWNVTIKTAVENISEGTRKFDLDLPIGVRRTKRGMFTAMRMTKGKLHRLGIYPTPMLAHAAYLRAAA